MRAFAYTFYCGYRYEYSKNICIWFEEGIATLLEHDNNVLPQDEVSIDIQVSANPPTMTDEDIKTTFLQMSQAITTEEQLVTTYVQVMMTQAKLGDGTPRKPTC